ncbi:terminase small subunit [Pseudochrobactrum sp. XF203]|uniref:terminase small subunit n=1 Tax=Pseudochrobactrum sp. XF203 TaxID=2879116 RepID=UPI001CE284BC|nr:terminase small subunit [Pseudochrobactrum sp. XF203]UCA47030.1 terminase small subunit [Pseudochrobactrum sp. XF203]
MTLTAKQERFVSEYLIDLNATQAAIRAGYSEKTAQEQSSRLLSNVMVQQAVSDAQSRVAEKAEWSAADRLRMLADIADANIKDDPRVAVSAIAEANKMQGSHAPTRTEHTGKDGKPIEVKTLADFYANPQSGTS